MQIKIKIDNYMKNDGNKNIIFIPSKNIYLEIVKIKVKMKYYFTYIGLSNYVLHI